MTNVEICGIIVQYMILNTFYGEKDMKKYTTNKYYVVPPAGYPNVIFCRMNGSQSTNDWPNKWNQTQDLTIPNDGKNTCTISNHWAEKATGSWSKK